MQLFLFLIFLYTFPFSFTPSINCLEHYPRDWGSFPDKFDVSVMGPFLLPPALAPRLSEAKSPGNRGAKAGVHRLNGKAGKDHSKVSAKKKKIRAQQGKWNRKADKSTAGVPKKKNLRAQQGKCEKKK